jgi:hypothetical protein
VAHEQQHRPKPPETGVDLLPQLVVGADDQVMMDDKGHDAIQGEELESTEV